MEQARQDINKLNSILWSKQITQNKKQSIACTEESHRVSLYNKQKTGRQFKKLEAVQIYYLRSSYGVTEGLTKEEIRRNMEIEKRVT